MKWPWITLAVLVAAIALVAICGAMLPVKHVASRRARYRQSAETIWAAIAREKTFREDDVNYEVVESTAPERMVTRITDKNLPYGGSWTYEITREADGAALRITENGEVYNPIFRFVSRFIMGHTATIDTRLRGLGKQFGEDVRIED